MDKLSKADMSLSEKLMLRVIILLLSFVITAISMLITMYYHIPDPMQTKIVLEVGVFVGALLQLVCYPYLVNLFYE